MKKVIYLLVLSLALFACGKKENKEAETEKQAKVVKLIEAKKELLNGQIRGNGSFEPANEAAQVSQEGEVVKVYYKNGDFVKAGTVVVQLEDRGIKSSYETARANLMNAEANYNKSLKFSKIQEQTQFESVKASMISAKESLDKARRGSKSEEIDIAKLAVNSAKLSFDQVKFNYDRNKKLYEEKLISQSAFLDIETQYLSAKSNYDKAQKNLELIELGADKEDIRKLEANYNQAKASYDLAQKNISEKVWENTITTYESSYLIAKANYELAKKNYDDLTVRAKIDGIIANLNVKTFERTTKNGDLFYVIDDKFMNIKVGLSASEMIQVAKGSKAKVFVEEIGQALEGEVIELDPSADPKTNKFMITVKVPNEKGIIKKGMYAKVEIDTSTKEMLVVPKNAVVVKNLNQYIFKVENGLAKQIKVEIGNATEDLQEILTDEIKKGDKIVIDGQYLLQDNDRVEEVK